MIATSTQEREDRLALEGQAGLARTDPAAAVVLLQRVGAQDITLGAQAIDAASSACAGATTTLEQVAKALDAARSSIRRRPWRRTPSLDAVGVDLDLAHSDLTIVVQDLALHEWDLQDATARVDKLAEALASADHELDTDDVDLQVRHACRQRHQDLRLHTTVLEQSLTSTRLVLHSARAALTAVATALQTTVPAALAASQAQSAITLSKRTWQP